MTTYTALLDAILAQDKPLTQAIARALRDNPLAIAEGSPGSPSIIGLNPLVILSASSSPSLDFTASIDGTYDLYEFELIDITPASSGVDFQIQASTNGGTTWNVVNFNTGVAGGTTAVNAGQIKLTSAVFGGSSTQLSGIFRLYAPASSKGAKVFSFETVHSNGSGTWNVNFGGGVMNSSGNAINALRFIMSSGNIASGKIVMRPRRKAVTN